MKINSGSKFNRYLPWIIFGTGMLYYCFAYLLRVYPTVMEHHLLSHFNVGVKDFGFITGFYYFAYAPMQLPIGVTVDRIGARRSLLLGCTIATLGVLIFATTQSIHLALFGRFLIGFGAAFGYVTALKIASLWLPQRIFATAIGFLTGAGMLAAIATDNNLTHLSRITDFHSVLLFPAYAGLILFIVILLFVRNKEGFNADNLPVSQNASYKKLCLQLWGIIKKPQMWVIGVVGALLYLPSSVFVDAWAIPFFRTARHFTAQQGAYAASLTLAGWIISSFVSGYLSDRFETRKVIFQCPQAINNSEAAFLKAVEFELLWLKNKQNHYKAIAHEDSERIKMMEARYQKSIENIHAD
jgi:fucose permease